MVWDISTVEAGLLVAIIIGFAVIVYTRRLNFKRSIEDNDDDSSKSSGISKRVIRYTSVIMLIPIIGILATRQIISAQGTTALFGVIIGYMLRGFDERDESASSSNS